MSQQHSSRPPVALVTGGTGYIGRHLTAALATGGWEVRVCGRRPRPHDLPPEVDYGEADLTSGDTRLLGELCQDVTVVFNLAGATSSRSSPEQMREVNVDGTERLLEAAERAGVGRVVHVSTSSVYGSSVALPQPVPEDVECHPSAGYGQTKWEAEQLLWQFADKGLRVSVLRPVTVYGPGAVKLLASTTLDAAIERFAGRTNFAVGREPVELRMVHVDDVVAALLHLASSQETIGRAFNLSAGVYPTSHEIAQAVAEEVGLDLELSDDPDAGMSHDQRAATRERMLAAGMSGDILLQPERVRFLKKANRNNRLSLEALRATGFEPQVTDVDASVRATVRWYREQRWIL